MEMDIGEAVSLCVIYVPEALPNLLNAINRVMR